jgi:hypothetical protein
MVLPCRFGTAKLTFVTTVLTTQWIKEEGAALSGEGERHLRNFNMVLPKVHNCVDVAFISCPFPCLLQIISSNF